MFLFVLFGTLLNCHYSALVSLTFHTFLFTVYLGRVCGLHLVKWVSPIWVLTVRWRSGMFLSVRLVASPWLVVSLWAQPRPFLGPWFSGALDPHKNYSVWS